MYLLSPSSHPPLTPSFHPPLTPSSHTLLSPSSHTLLSPSFHTLLPSSHPPFTLLSPSFHPPLTPSSPPLTLLSPSSHPPLTPSSHPPLTLLSACIGSIPVARSFFASSSGPIFLDNAACVGNETRLLDCFSRDQLGIHDCSSSEHAGVICPGKWFCVHCTYICTCFNER